MKLIILEEPDLVLWAAVEIVNAAQRSIFARGYFCIALSGGETPEPLYSLIAREYGSSIPWDKTHIFFSDERCVPPDDPESNFRMVDKALLSHVPLPAENIHRMKGEIEPGKAVEEYSEEIRRVFGTGTETIPRFDLVMLGIGEDCHTASIFPGLDVIHESKALVAAPYVPEHKARRLTFTPLLIHQARNIIVLAVGEKKADAIARALESPRNIDDCPAQIINESLGDVTLIMDPPAASLLHATPVK